MILVDTSVLVGALTGTRDLAPTLRGVVDAGERLAISSIVLYEWRRGPRLEAELVSQEELIPAETAWPFGTAEAVVAASLYRRVASPRQRQIDIAVAAAALTRGAQLWTANVRDFADIPELRLFEPA